MDRKKLSNAKKVVLRSLDVLQSQADKDEMWSSFEQFGAEYVDDKGTKAMTEIRDLKRTYIVDHGGKLVYALVLYYILFLLYTQLLIYAKCAFKCTSV